MARARPELADGEAIGALIDGQGRLAVRVTPGARSESLTVTDGQAYAKVRARPQDGKANKAVIKLVAKALRMAPSRVRLLRGETARDKTFKIEA